MQDVQSQWTTFVRELVPTDWSLTDPLPFVVRTDHGEVSWVCQRSELQGELLIEECLSDDGSLRLVAEYRRHDDTRSVLIRLWLSCSRTGQGMPALSADAPCLRWQTKASEGQARVFSRGARTWPLAHDTRVEVGTSEADEPVLIATADEAVLVALIEASHAWSGQIARDHADGFVIGFKHQADGEKEPLELPAVHLVFASGGLDGASNALRHYLASHVVREQDAPTVTCKAAGDMDDLAVMHLVDLAARIGCEQFACDSNRSSRSLKQIGDRVRAKGMRLSLSEGDFGQSRILELPRMREERVVRIPASSSADAARLAQIAAHYLVPGQLIRTELALPEPEGAAPFSDYDIACHMLGGVTIESDLAGLEPDDLDRLARMIEVFKTYRELLTQDFYPLAAQTGDSQVIEFTARSGQEAIVFAFAGTGSSLSETVHLKGLRTNAQYVVRRLAGATKSTHTGEELMHSGIPVRVNAGSFAAWHVGVADTRNLPRGY